MVPSLRSMRYFTTALRHGSISAAALELNVSASAISAAIDQIEAHFELKLTTRQRARGVTATADGKVMLRKFATLLEEYEAVLRDGVDLKHSFRGDLRIGYYAPVAPAFLPEILSTLTAPEDDLTLHLEACDNAAAQQGLRRGDFDVILFVPDTADPELDVTPLLQAPAYCLLAADHPLAARESLSLDDLSDQAIAMLDRPLVADYYRRLLDLAGHRPRVIAYCNSTEMIRSIVGKGKACALLNMLPLTELSYAGDRVVARPISDELPALTLSVGFLAGRPRRAVLEFAAQCKGVSLGVRRRHLQVIGPVDGQKTIRAV